MSSVLSHSHLLPNGEKPEDATNYPHHSGHQALAQESLECGRDQNLSYRLPPLIEAAQKRWIRTFQDGAIIAAILTLVSIEFITHNLNSSASSAILSHASFLLNLSAVFSAVLLVKRIGSLAELSSRRDNDSVPQSGYIAAGGAGGGSLLRWYGLRKPWFLLMVHWAVCFSFGIGCLFAQIMLLASNSSVRTATACVLGFAAVPMVFAFRLVVD